MRNLRAVAVVATLVVPLALEWGATGWGLGTQVAEAQPGPSGTEASQPAGRATFEGKFWRFLHDAAPAYRTWAPWPGTDGEFFAGKAPHGALMKTYVNRRVAAKPDELPPGSVIVAENYAADGETLLAVTVMYRVEKFDPEHRDWYWIKYQADGTVAASDDRRLAGKVASCIDCHSKAAEGDFLFAND